MPTLLRSLVCELSEARRRNGSVQANPTAPLAGSPLSRASPLVPGPRCSPHAGRLNAKTFPPASPSQWRVHASINLAPPRQRVRSPVSLLRLVADDMRKGVLGQFAREMRLVARPVAERASETMRRVGRLDPPQQHFEGHAGKGTAGPSAGKNIVARPPRLSFPRGREWAIG